MQGKGRALAAFIRVLELPCPAHVCISVLKRGRHRARAHVSYSGFAGPAGHTHAEKLLLLQLLLLPGWVLLSPVATVAADLWTLLGSARSCLALQLPA
eukprot:1159959-Pelagomonas_calceolata.AAC.8